MVVYKEIMDKIVDTTMLLGCGICGFTVGGLEFRA